MTATLSACVLDPGAAAETSVTETADAEREAICDTGTVVAWDDIEAVRATIPDGCDVWLLAPEPEPEPAGERHQRLFEWSLAGNDLDDFPEIEMVYPDGVIVDTTRDFSAEVGESVSFHYIEAVRATGASVYVSPRGDGGGLVVDPDGPLPDQVRADIEAVPQRAVGTDEVNVASSQLTALVEAMRDCGVRAFRVAYFNLQPHFGAGSWSVGRLGWEPAEPSNVPLFDTTSPTREGALARAAAEFAEIGWGRYEVIG
ncbi:hypothetical protein [Xylanimonas ulmi]|uniref:Uncharacterized protein n=1 Tax=Xylanimonas ulmi TaxID=228973 RepID=A0A4V2EYG9_9MICO|nr:hypothetical protein [Xylanibacterium ulmi]RZS62950.1 hypothetical protein EV386_3307 [Xylanibacterium ulmi]